MRYAVPGIGDRSLTLMILGFMIAGIVRAISGMVS
jgi:hypothetical protein